MQAPSAVIALIPAVATLTLAIAVLGAAAMLALPANQLNTRDRSKRHRARRSSAAVYAEVFQNTGNRQQQRRRAKENDDRLTLYETGVRIMSSLREFVLSALWFGNAGLP